MRHEVCREGQLTHSFFPGRVGRGYGPDWTLVFVVSLAPIGWLVGWLAWLLSCLVVWLVWLVGWLVGLIGLVGWLVGWFRWLVGRFVGCCLLFDRLVGRLCGCWVILVGWLVVSLVGWLVCAFVCLPIRVFTRSLALALARSFAGPCLVVACSTSPPAETRLTVYRRPLHLYEDPTMETPWSDIDEV